MNTKKICNLVIALVLITISVGAVQAEVPTVTSPSDDLALYADASASDNGWGGGSSKTDLTDGLRTYSGWARGLAFWYNQWHQVTIDFGHQVTFNRVIQWYHGGMNTNEAAKYKLQYWDGSSWVDIFETSNSHDYLKYPDATSDSWWYYWSTPYENTFTPVTSNKLRILNYPLSGSHTWLYEVEVYNDLPTDVTPPTTSDNSPSTWQNTDFTVTLTCTDSDSGCRETLYSIDGGMMQTGTSILISEEGDHTIEYYSIDNAGNEEIPETTHAKLDKTSPAISIISPEPKDYIQTEIVFLNIASTDVPSGIASTTVTIDGTTIVDDKIDLRTLTLGPHTLTIEAVDIAGNKATRSITFNIKPVPATIDVKPNTLNKASQSGENAVTAYLEIPDYDINLIDRYTVTMSTSKGIVSAQLSPTGTGDYDNDGLPDIMVKFDRQAISAIIDMGDKVKITINGKIDGAIFEGSDAIRVIHQGKK